MRNKLILIIIGCVLTAVTVSSCLHDSFSDEYSSEATVRAFAIDSIGGKNYRFKIDQINRLIYNEDSLPVIANTLLSNIQIDTFSVSGYIVTGDTLFTAPAYANLLPAANSKNGMKFTIYAPDAETNNQYTLRINIHQQNPDTVSWSKVTTVPAAFTSADIAQNQKAVIFGNSLLVYTYPDLSSISVYSTDISRTSYQWEEQTISGLPTDVEPSSIVAFKDKLYIKTESGDVYSSEDGIVWAQSALGGDIKQLLTGFTDRLCGIKTVSGTDYFCYTTDESAAWAIGEEVSANFPTEDIYSSVYTTATGVEKAVLVGSSTTETDRTTPWFTTDGSGWASMTTTTDDYCPALSKPLIMNYDGLFYLTGSGLNNIYESLTGILWEEAKTKIEFPAEVSSREHYSMVIDQNKYIWLVVSESGNNAVWRGRLNRYGFSKQK